jgi:ACDE family multidrug resistance protein
MPSRRPGSEHEHAYPGADGAPTAATAGPDRSQLYRDPALQAVFAISIIAVTGVASIAPVLPELADALGIGAASIGLLVASFSLPAVIVSPFLGLVADRVGRRAVLAASLFLFAIAGTACAFARDFNTLLILRSLQGLSAAPLQALSITLIGDLYTGPARATAVGLNGTVISTGAIVIPILSGFIASMGPFYPFALALLAAPVALLVLRRLDSSASGPVTSVRGQIQGVLRCAMSPSALGLFAAGILTMVLFFGAQITYMPLLMGGEFSSSPAVIGIVMSVTHVMFALTSSQFGRIGARVRALPLIGLSFAVYGCAALLTPFLTSAWMLAIPAALFGLAHGVNIPTQQMGLVAQAPREFRAAFMSLNTTVVRTGQTIGPLLVGLFYVAGGFNAAFLASAALAFAASLVSLGLNARLKGAHT